MRRAASTLAAALALAVPGYGHAAGSIEVVTVPQVPGARFVVDGETFVADGRGVAHVPEALGRPGLTPKALDQRLGTGVRAKFATWYGSAGSGRLMATYDTHYLIEPKFFDLRGNPVEESQVTAATVRSSIGVRYDLAGGKATWLQAGRVVPLNGALEPKDIYYTFERVLVAGANVVNDGQQKFFPSKGRTRGSGAAEIPVELLFYRARFTARDAFFGFAIGDAVRLVWPSGHVERYPIGEGGVVVIPALPRGEYQVAVEGFGISLGGPVTLSKDQDVEVALLSYFDVALVVSVALAFAIGLPLTRRRHLLERLARRGGPPSTVRANAVGMHADVVPSNGDGAPTDTGGNARVRLNAASVEELRALPGVGHHTAHEIVEHRARQGGFHSVDDLHAVRGIGPNRLENLRNLVEPM